MHRAIPLSPLLLGLPHFAIVRLVGHAKALELAADEPKAIASVAFDRIVGITEGKNQRGHDSHLVASAQDASGNSASLPGPASTQESL